MAIMAKESGGDDFILVPEGTHLAICNMVVDLGLQETNYGHKHQVFIRWELPEERTEDRPMIIHQFYTLSLSDKANLRRDLQSWRGKAFTKEELDGFDVGNVLGSCCQVTVTHNETPKKTYANIASVAGWPKGMPKPKAENKLLLYDDDNNTYARLPEWLQTKIDIQLPSHEDVAREPGSAETEIDLDDEIPF